MGEAANADRLPLASIVPLDAESLKKVSGRFLDLKRESERQARLLWLGTLAAHFTDFELQYLDDLRLLSPMDHSHVRSARTGAPHPFITNTREGEPRD